MTMSIDDSNPITNPFYYAQDVDGYLQELDDQQRLRDIRSISNDEQQSKSKKSSNKRKCSQTASSSFVIHQDSAKRGRRVIQINIYEVNNQEGVNVNNLNAKISAQYVVEDTYDEVMDATNNII